MKKQVVVIGLGRFGSSVALTLQSIGHDILAIDRSENCVQYISNSITHAVQADAINENILKELGVGNFDIAAGTQSTNCVEVQFRQAAGATDASCYGNRVLENPPMSLCKLIGEGLHGCRAYLAIIYPVQP